MKDNIKMYLYVLIGTLFYIFVIVSFLSLIFFEIGEMVELYHVWKAEGNTTRDTHRRWEDNIKVGLNETVCEDVDLPLDGVLWWDFTWCVRELQVS
jgi:hypothetical protein